MWSDKHDPDLSPRRRVRAWVPLTAVVIAALVVIAAAVLS